jgi:hypothetical protein
MTDPDLSQFAAAAPRLTAPALVVGSAPGARCPGDVAGWHLLSVNASQVVAEEWGLDRPALTLFGTTVLGMRPSNRAAQNVLRGHKTGCLIVMRDGSNRLVHEFNLWRMGYHYERRAWLDTDTRLAMLRSMVGDELARMKPSNGIVLALLALFLGAPRVVMAGFSLGQTGHAYNAANHPRNHVDADREVLRGIVARQLPITTTSAELAAATGIQII